MSHSTLCYKTPFFQKVLNALEAVTMIIAASTNDTVLHPLLVNPPQVIKNVPFSVFAIISPRSRLCTKTSSNVRALVVQASPITSKRCPYFRLLMRPQPCPDLALQYLVQSLVNVFPLIYNCFCTVLQIIKSFFHCVFRTVEHTHYDMDIIIFTV